MTLFPCLLMGSDNHPELPLEAFRDSGLHARLLFPPLQCTVHSPDQVQADQPLQLIGDSRMFLAKGSDDSRMEGDRFGSVRVPVTARGLSQGQPTGDELLDDS